MEKNITTTLAAEGEKQNAKRNPLARFFSAVNKKRRQIVTSITAMVTMATAVTAFADDTSGGGGIPANEGEAQFNAVIEFFALWIGRIGLVVGFVGAVMFALAIKNDDAEAKTRGLMTLASGFVVFGVTKALDMFI